jgi:hypothetical protein
MVQAGNKTNKKLRKHFLGYFNNEKRKKPCKFWFLVIMNKKIRRSPGCTEKLELF